MHKTFHLSRQSTKVCFSAASRRRWVECRDNLRLKGEKLQDTRTMTKQRKQIEGLESQLKNQTEKSTELQRALHDHQSIASDNHSIIDELQDRVSHLQTVGFVMGDRAKRFSEQVQPRFAEVATLTEQRSHQDQELARTLSMVASLKQTVSEKQKQLRCSHPIPLLFIEPSV